MRTALFLIGLLRGHIRWALAGLVLSVLAALANIALLAVSGGFITGMALAGAAGAGFNYFLPSATIRACAILRTGGRYLERLATHEATFRLIASLRARLFLGLAPRLPFGDAGAHSGDLAARLGGDLDSLQRAYLQILVPAGAALLVGAVVVAYAGTLSTAAALVIAAGLLVGGAIAPALLVRAGRRPGEEAVTALAALRVWAVDMADGREELAAFGALGRIGERLDVLQARLTAAQRRAARLDAVAGAVAQLVGSLMLWAVVLVGAPVVAAGALGASDLVTLAFLALASAEVTGPLGGAFAAWGAIAAASERIRPLLARQTEPPSITRPAPRATAPHLRLDGLRVRYPDATEPALDGLTLDLPPGARVALVGASGSGKSTVVAALAGFLPVEGGRILLDGQPVADGALAPLLSVAPQTPHLLSGSLRRNLRIAAPGASDEVLRGACATAGLGPWLAALPEGLDTAIGTGGRALSGGEARRLTVARALLAEAPLLILDEPGEGLDPATERRMLEAILDARPDGGLLLITHRPTVLERMDHIVVLDRGRVLEQGPPRTLASRDGPFRRFLERSYV